MEDLKLEVLFVSKMVDDRKMTDQRRSFAVSRPCVFYKNKEKGGLLLKEKSCTPRGR